MITDQQLVGVTAVHGSKTVPQSIGASMVPIVSCGLYRLVVFSFEVGLVSSLVINEDYLCELQQLRRKKSLGLQETVSAFKKVLLLAVLTKKIRNKNVIE